MSPIGSLTIDQIKERVHYNPSNIDDVINRLILHDVLRTWIAGVCIGDKFKEHVHNLSLLFDDGPLKSSSKSLITPSAINTPKKIRTNRWTVWGWMWRIIVGAGIVVGLIVGIGQMIEWGWFDNLVPSPR